MAPGEFLEAGWEKEGGEEGEGFRRRASEPD